MSRRYGQGPFDPFERSPFEGFQQVKLPRPPRRFWIGLGFFAAALAVFIFTQPLIGFITENQWFDALGLGTVYRTRVATQFWLFLIAFLLAFLVAGLNGFLALSMNASGGLRAVGIRRRIVRTPRGYLALGVSLFLALILGLTASSSWQEWLLFINARPSGVSEPLFGLDVSFYLLTMPFLRALQSWLFGLVFFTGLLAAGLHAWNGLTIDFRFSRRAIGHLSALLGLLALIIAFGTVLDRYNLVSAHNGVVYGAGYTDVNIRSALAVFQALLALVLAVLLFVNLAIRRVVVPAGSLAVWLIAAILIGVVPSVVQRVQVQPAEPSQEAPYIQREIDYTRKSYGIDHVQVRPYGGNASITSQDLANDSATIDNLRLWDDTQIHETYQQLQSIRTYYSFPQIDLDRYLVDGRTRQLQISARELEPDRLPSQAQRWVNQRLEYTHGYSVAASPVSAVAGEGLPDYVARDIPTQGPLTVTRPQIYFGQTGAYVLAPSKAQEFDYPQGDLNVRTNYSGQHGVPLSGANRALWSLRTGDFNLLVSDQISNKTQMLFRRNIQERVSAIAPFLDLYDNPYVVVSKAGRIYWIQDAYVSADGYPYAQPVPLTVDQAGGHNYVRNSVKAVVDAYEGTVDFYISDSHDPIIAAYSRAFPNLMKPLSAMPTDLQAHLRVPPKQFEIQAVMYATYHIADSNVLYNREDVWDLALARPYYVQMRLPGESRVEYLQIIPFSPRNKQNLTGWLAVRNDPGHYGELIAYVLPKDKVVLGPQQIASRIQQTPAFSSDKTLLNQQGSGLIEGNLLVVPIGDSFLYFEPIYLRATGSGSSLPELKRVILTDATGQTPVVYQPTLQNALAQLIGEQPPPTLGTPGQPAGPAPAGDTQKQIADLVTQANALYTDAQAALKRGDLATYAKDVDQIGQILKQIDALQHGTQPAPPPGTSASPGVPTPQPSASPSRSP
ncbi:MAG: UPF0182 family membrane protein [Candidatus Dormibacter sp.]|uniref:UPF0182 family membrane protein n=1 Tax=Candidatus Dormibacter sp. TaxID=2973982 RepID=UPI000DB80CEA|nr:MAG: UPF0182 family protein [Candidatus Dormibacteraeota bacterium]